MIQTLLIALSLLLSCGALQSSGEGGEKRSLPRLRQHQEIAANDESDAELKERLMMYLQQAQNFGGGDGEYDLDYEHRRLRWGWVDLLYGLGICPGVPICPDPCHGPHPPKHHCDSDSRSDSSSGNGTSSRNGTSADDEVDDFYAFDASEGLENGQVTGTEPTSRFNPVWYIIAALAATTVLTAFIIRKGQEQKNDAEKGLTDGKHKTKHGLFGAVRKRLRKLRKGQDPDIPAPVTDEPPKFIEMKDTSIASGSDSGSTKVSSAYSQMDA